MKKDNILIVALMYLFLLPVIISSPSYGFVRHDWELQETREVEETLKLADEALLIIYLYELPVEDEKLDVHWLSIRTADKRVYKTIEGLYVISFRSNERKKSLYILFDKNEEYFAANFDGEFHLDDATIAIEPESNDEYESLKKNLHGKSWKVK